MGIETVQARSPQQKLTRNAHTVYDHRAHATPGVVGILAIVVHRVHFHGNGHLSEIAHALGTARRFARNGQSWQQKGNQQCDDRDDHKQFDESKPTLEGEARCGGVHGEASCP